MKKPIDTHKAICYIKIKFTEKELRKEVQYRLWQKNMITENCEAESRRYVERRKRLRKE